MGIDSRKYDPLETELIVTNLYDGDHDDIDNAGDNFTPDIDLTVSLEAVVDFKVTPSGSTDGLIIALYKRRDENWDDAEQAIWSTVIAASASEWIYHFTILESYGAGHYRFLVDSEGGTNTFDVDIAYHASRIWKGIA